jgi:hypothetical protein
MPPGPLIIALSTALIALRTPCGYAMLPLLSHRALWRIWLPIMPLVPLLAF